MGKLLRLLAVWLLATASLSAQGQLGAGAISGVVIDPSGSAVPGAKVIVKDPGTGFARETVTGDDGQFLVSVLPPANYIVRLEKSGFSTLEQKTATVTVGSATTLHFQLKVDSVETVVEVSAGAVLVDATRTEEASLVSREELQDLPLNGRRYDQFALLVPGVTRDATFGLLSFRGMSGVWNNFMVEGNNDNQAYNAEARGRTRVASNLSADAIQEFQVGQSNYQAEFGRAVGGSVNAVVRSGSNTFHGDAFYYYKDDNLSARDTFANFRPFERRQQFGGSVGGPLKRDKLFYFLNYDQQLRDWPQVFQNTTGVLTQGAPLPTSSTYQADLAAFNQAVAFIQNQITTNMPGNLLPRNFNHNLVLVKTDWLVSPKNTVSITYNYLNHRADNGVFTNSLVTSTLSGNGRDEVHTNTLNARLTTVFSGHAVNELRAHYSRDFEFEFSPLAPPNVRVGSFPFGKSTSQDNIANADEHHYQFIDNFSWNLGRHDIKFGGEIEYITEYLNRPNNFSGGYSYANALAFGKDLVNPSGRNYTSFSQSFGLAKINSGVMNYAGFIQDQWKPLRRLTVNWGLRYDYQALPHPYFPNSAIPESTTINSDHTNFGPRGGVAWDLAGNGRTIAHFGYGMFFSPTPLGTIDNVLRQTGLADPTKSLLQLSYTPTTPGAPIYPGTFSEIPTGANFSAPSATRLDQGFRRSRAQEADAGIERVLPGQVDVKVSYIYTKGDRLPFSYDTNLPPSNFTRTYVLPDGTSFSLPYAAGVTRTAAGVS